MTSPQGLYLSTCCMPLHPPHLDILGLTHGQVGAPTWIVCTSCSLGGQQCPAHCYVQSRPLLSKQHPGRQRTCGPDAGPKWHPLLLAMLRDDDRARLYCLHLQAGHQFKLALLAPLSNELQVPALQGAMCLC